LVLAVFLSTVAVSDVALAKTKAGHDGKSHASATTHASKKKHTKSHRASGKGASKTKKAANHARQHA
jgi:hypothetical protein